MKIRELLLLLAIGLLPLASKAQVNSETKFKMFCTALDNFSTAPNYIVVTVKNLKTGEIKEICTEAPFIEGAVGYETGNSFLKCSDYKTRYFEFANDSALRNISFDLYSKKELAKFAKTIDVEKSVQQVKSGGIITKGFSGHNDKEQLMFAHLMFNNGILMSRGCIAGNICRLTYFQPN